MIGCQRESGRSCWKLPQALAMDIGLANTQHQSKQDGMKNSVLEAPVGPGTRQSGDKLSCQKEPDRNPYDTEPLRRWPLHESENESQVEANISDHSRQPEFEPYVDWSVVNLKGLGLPCFDPIGLVLSRQSRIRAQGSLG